MDEAPSLGQKRILNTRIFGVHLQWGEARGEGRGQEREEKDKNGKKGRRPWEWQPGLRNLNKGRFATAHSFGAFALFIDLAPYSVKMR